MDQFRKNWYLIVKGEKMNHIFGISNKANQSPEPFKMVFSLIAYRFTKNELRMLIPWHNMSLLLLVYELNFSKDAAYIYTDSILLIYLTIVLISDTK